MKNHFFLCLSGFVLLFLSGCITKTDISPIPGKDTFTGGVGMETISENLPAPIFSGKNEYLSGYDGPLALISEENKDAVVIMTGEELLYRNEVYGFQVKLGKAWKGVRIYEMWFPGFGDEERTDHPDITFDMPDPDYNGVWGDVVLVRIMPFLTYKKAYEDCKNDPFGMCEPSYYEKARKNNKYYIIVGWNEQHDGLYETFYPYLECEDVVIDGVSSKHCPSAEKQLFSDWEVFDIE